MASTFKNFITNSVGTANTDVYSAPSRIKSSTIIGLTMSNLTVSDIKISLFLTSNNVDAFVFKDATIPSGSALVPVGGDQKLVLGPNDILKAYSNTDVSMDVIVSALEQD